MSFDRDAALIAAQHAFWRSGFDTTSVSTLTCEMGISPPSLYAAFGDKQRLFAEAGARYVVGFRSGVDGCLAEGTAYAALSELLRITALAHSDPDTPPGCLVLSEPRLADERTWLRHAIATRIERGCIDGDVPSGVDPDWIASFIEAVLVGMSSRARDHASRAELEAIAEQTITGLTSISPREGGGKPRLRTGATPPRPGRLTTR